MRYEAEHDHGYGFAAIEHGEGVERVDEEDFEGSVGVQEEYHDGCESEGGEDFEGEEEGGVLEDEAFGGGRVVGSISVELVAFCWEDGSGLKEACWEG